MVLLKGLFTQYKWVLNISLKLANLYFPKFYCQNYKSIQNWFWLYLKVIYLGVEEKFTPFGFRKKKLEFWISWHEPKQFGAKQQHSKNRHQWKKVNYFSIRLETWNKNGYYNISIHKKILHFILHKKHA